MPIVRGRALVDDPTMTEAASTSTALVASPRSARHGTTPSMPAAARCLADAAAAFRAAATAPVDGSAFALSLSDVESALGDLAAAAELSAYAVTEAGRPAGVPATYGAPTAARSLSWRLHGLRRELLAARDVCAEASRVAGLVARD
jgi:hypothetical protein